jgi:hypothetical protein
MSAVSGTLKVDNISNVGGSFSTTTNKAIDGTFLAWINFSRGTNGLIINQIHNIESLTESAVGRFQITFPRGLLSEGDFYGITGGGMESGFDAVAGAYLTGFDTDTKNSNFCQFTFSDRANAPQSPHELLIAVIQ